MKIRWQRCGELLASVEAATSPAPSWTISCACAGPPMHGHASRPEALGRAPRVGAMPVGRDEALGERDDRGPRGPGRGPAGAPMTSSSPREGTARKTTSARARPALEGLDPQLARQLDARAGRRRSRRRRQPLGLLGGARLQRRAQPAAGEQDRHRGPERSGADDGRPPRARRSGSVDGWRSGTCGEGIQTRLGAAFQDVVARAASPASCERRRRAGFAHRLEIEDAAVEEVERVGADDRVRRHAGLPGAGRDLGGRLALQRRAVEAPLAGR